MRKAKLCAVQPDGGPAEDAGHDDGDQEQAELADDGGAQVECAAPRHADDLAARFVERRVAAVSHPTTHRFRAGWPARGWAPRTWSEPVADRIVEARSRCRGRRERNRGHR